MARFFFDSYDGNHEFRDEQGLELDGPDEARLEAKRGLGDWAKDAIPVSTQDRKLAIAVRDEAGTVIFKGALCFDCSERQSGPVSNTGAI